MNDISELDRLLARGAEQARKVSGPKVEEVKQRIGLIIYINYLLFFKLLFFY